MTPTSTGTVLEQLRTTSLFGEMSARDLQRLADCTRVVVHDAGHVVTAEGSGAAGFHLVLDGTAAVEVHGVRRGTLRAGDYVGEVSLIDGKPRTATVRAETTLTTASITAWDFAPLLRTQPGLTLALLQGLCQRLRQLEALLA